MIFSHSNYFIYTAVVNRKDKIRISLFKFNFKLEYNQISLH